MTEDPTTARARELIANCPDSHAEIAAKVGVDKSLVTRWRSGARRPTAAQLARLEELYGRTNAPPTPPEPARSAKPRRKAPPPPPPPPPSGADDEDDEDAEDEDEESNTDRLRRYIREGIRELERSTELSGVKRAEAIKKLVDAQIALDRSTGENALTMQRIAAHPEFRRCVQRIVDALAQFPEALAAVAKAFP